MIFNHPPSLYIRSLANTRDVGLYGGCTATIGKGAKCFDFAKSCDRTTLANDHLSLMAPEAINLVLIVWKELSTPTVYRLAGLL